MLILKNLTTGLIGPVSLTVPAGSCVGLTGPSGVGKSLLLRAIADLDPNRGDVTLNGQDRAAMAAPDWRRLVALLPAESGWWAERVGAHFAPTPDMSPVLQDLGLPGAMSWEVARLSTGERQRLALARALQAAPKALLLDEPTAALDAEARDAVEALIRTQMEAGVAVLLVTHDPAQATRLCSEIYRVEAGGMLTEAAA